MSILVLWLSWISWRSGACSETYRNMCHYFVSACMHACVCVLTGQKTIWQLFLPNPTGPGDLFVRLGSQCLHTELSLQYQTLTLASEVGKGSGGSPRPGRREEPRVVLEPSLVKYELASSLDFWVSGGVGVTGCFVNKEKSLGRSVLRHHLHQQALLPSWFPTFSLCASTLSQA